MTPEHGRIDSRLASLGFAVVKPVTEPVPLAETCVVCEEGFATEEQGVPFKAVDTLRWQHIHVRCLEGNVVRDDRIARIARRVRDFVRRS